MSSKLKVLIADDHAILRAGLVRLLQDLPEVGTVGEVGNGTDALHRLHAEHWDVLVLDLDMPGQNSLDVLKRTKNDHPDIAVLILSMYPEEQFALRALKAGAAGYLNKKDAPEHLLMAVRRVAEGGAYISANLAAMLAKSLQARPVDVASELLSDREFTVLRGIAAGRSMTDIATELRISNKTVSTYRSRLLTKLNLHSNVELARYAIERGLVK